MLLTCSPERFELTIFERPCGEQKHASAISAKLANHTSLSPNTNAGLIRENSKTKQLIVLRRSAAIPAIFPYLGTGVTNP